MAWTNPRTWVAGEKITAALLNQQLRDNLLALDTAPYSYRYIASDTPIANGAWTDLTNWSLKSEDGVTYSGGLFTVPSTGRYVVAASVSFNTSSTGVRGLRPVIAGTTDQNIIMPGNASFQAVCVLYRELTIAAGQTVKFQVYQNAGAPPAAQVRGDAAGLFSTAVVRRAGN